MKKLIILPTLILLVSTASAQFIKFHVGLTSGVNSTIPLSEGLAADPRYNVEYTYAVSPIGFTAGIDFNRKIGLNIETIKSFQEQVYQIIDAAEAVKGERKLSLDYIQLPLMLKLMSNGTSATRANFSFGPQLNFLTNATESIQAQAGTYTIPQGTDFESVKQEFPSAMNNGNGTYTLPSDMPKTDLYSSKVDDFKSTQFCVAGAFGLDIDLAKHLYLTTMLRATYSLTDVTNGEVLNRIKDGNANTLVGERANLNVGFQIGLHYMFGSTRKWEQRKGVY